MRAAVLILGLALTVLSLWQIESVRPRSVEMTKDVVGTTPVTLWRQENAIATVIVAHGFAGSRQLMNAFNWTLARNGYDVVAYDLLGHGTNPTPMSGDLDAIEGTTELLVGETAAVIDWVGGRPALLGHSMATDLLVRVGLERDIGPIVAISAFSGAVTADHPKSLLLIAGEWEGRLIEFGRDAIGQIDPAAAEGDRLSGGVDRMALIAPNVEHVGILYSPFALRESVLWLDAAYGVAPREPEVAAIGYWVLLLLGALMILWWPMSRFLPAVGGADPVSWRSIWWCSIAVLVTPVCVVWIEARVLPVLVADYLVLHLGFAGILQLALLRAHRVSFGRLAPVATVALLAWGLGVFGLAIDTYAANFHPNAERAIILAALVLGAVPFMVADAIATQGGRGPFWQRMVLRTAFFLSLGLAVALAFERLFFLFLIAPVILLFFLIFGMMGRWTADRAGPLASGVALGLILAWSLGVTFPLFQA